MSLSAEARSRLAAEQAALVGALVAGEEPPAAFDAARVRAAAASLADKRARSLAQAWPELHSALANRFAARFAEFALLHELPRDGGPLADGRCFARWLAAQGELPDEGRLEALAVDLRYRSVPAGLRPRRLPAGWIAWFGTARRLIIALRLPGVGECWLRLPLGK